MSTTRQQKSSHLRSPMLDEKHRQRIVAAFVKDAILEAAVDHTAYELREYRLVDLFTCLFASEMLTEHLDGTLRHLDDDSIFPAPVPKDDQSSAQLDSILGQFGRNLRATEGRTGISIGIDHKVSLEELMGWYGGTIYRAARCLPWAPRFLRWKSADPFVSSMTESSTLNVLSNLTMAPGDLVWPNLPETAVSPLIAMLKDAEATTRFTCGGSIDVSTSSCPLALRYDDPHGLTKKIMFDDRQDAGLLLAIEDLVAACGVATFGFQGKDVLDLEYRNASKLEPAEFSSNFHPFDHGVLDAITKIMLPLHPSASNLRAELYKLNIYGPAGCFKSHVDTPRSETQFGSLVVCLPCAHEGGVLIIRHQGQEIKYDWGASAGVEWAAFYSDCEHEVLEVTSGWRVTLTYNLHFQPSELTATITGAEPINLETLPLYQNFSKALRDPSFIHEGGLVGFHCRHAYPRERHDNSMTVEACLKGVDRALFLVLESLGIQVGIRPVLDCRKLEEWREEEDEDDDCYSTDAEIANEIADETYQAALHKSQHEGPFKDMLRQAEDGSRLPRLIYEDPDRPVEHGLWPFHQRLDNIVTTRRIKGLPEWKPPRLGVDRVGHGLGEVEFANGLHERHSDADELFTNWAPVYGIRWLNKQKADDLALAYMAYGNEAELDHFYASVAIIARIPPFESKERAQKIDE